MTTKTQSQQLEIRTDSRLALAWFVRYNADAYALGPLRFDRLVSARQACEEAERCSGRLPAEVWPTGETVTVDEYDYEVTID